MSGSTPPPPNEIKAPELDPDTAAPDITPDTKENAPALAGIVSDISTKTGAVSPDPEATPAGLEVQDSPLDQVPTLDLRKLNRSVIEFLVKLKMSLPREKAEAIDEFAGQIKMTVVKIGMNTEDLRTTGINLTPQQKQYLAEAVAAMPQLDPSMEGFTDTSKQYWDKQLEILISILSQLQSEQLTMLGEVDEAGFHVNRKFLVEINSLLESMVKSTDQFALPVYRFILDENDKRHLGQIKERIIQRITQGKAKTGSEDLADQEIDQMLYQDFVKGLESTTTTPKERAQKLTTAIAINFYHLRNSLAAQIATTLMNYEFFLDDVDVENKLYQKDGPDSLFENEAAATAYLLTVINQCTAGVISTQKLADLIRQAENKSC